MEKRGCRCGEKEEEEEKGDGFLLEIRTEGRERERGILGGMGKSLTRLGNFFSLFRFFLPTSPRCVLINKPT